MHMPRIFHLDLHLSRGFAILAILAGITLTGYAETPMARYNVVWDRPSQHAAGQMPMGNGDIAAGVYTLEDGDLYLLLSKNDALTYNGDLFKTGRVRVALTPNPFTAGKPFRQTLDLPTGSILIEADGVRVRIWADAHHPVYHVQIQAPEEISVTAVPEFWTRFDDCSYNTSRAPIAPPTQDVHLERERDILWYFAVGDRSVYPAEMEYYDVPQLSSVYPDPYRFNTFGHLLESPEMFVRDGLLRGRGTQFDLRIHALAKQIPEPANWIKAIEQQAARPLDVEQDWAAHRHWWTTFWNRSWILASDNTLPDEEREQLHGDAVNGVRRERDGGALVAQSYNVFRFLMACQSRGNLQTKFNGGLFTQPLHVTQQPRRLPATQQADGSWLTHEDARAWGRRFTFQNQRLLYWPLLMSGDGDLMQPFFDYYADLLPIRKAITQAWFGHDGAYYRENIEPTGGERDCGRDGKPPKTKPGENEGKGYYHSYYFTCGLETLAMMIEYQKISENQDFLHRVLEPFAREVLLFFDQHYPRDPDGKIRLDPAMVLETWWIAVNPAPDVAGLQYCLDELLAMKAGSASDQSEWQRFRQEIPAIFLHEIEGRTAIAPAKTWDMKKNSENGLLYPVFPFTCFGLGHGTEDIVDWTMRHRTHKNAFGYKCWTQDQIHWAYAGNAAEAQAGLVHRFRNASTECRFPLYGRSGPDSCPDFDHFGAGSTALQRMLVQEAGGKILLLPAWPADWDADFKLHVGKSTTIRGTVTDGALTEWHIEPAHRRKDVVVYEPQAAPPLPRVPANTHGLRVGMDQAGGNPFRGSIGRATLHRGVLGPDVIRALAGEDREKETSPSSVISDKRKVEPGSILPSQPADFEGALSLEAWIRPGANESGRIFDKLTPGQRDGFLIDCWPGQSVRVIVGPDEHLFPDVLKPDTWHHVLVVISQARVDTYLDGIRL